MTRRTRKLLLVAGLAVSALLALTLLAPAPEPPRASAPSTRGEPRAHDGSARRDAKGGSDLLTYAVDIDRLPGLPRSAPPDTSLQLWVLWRPPAVRRPRLQLLLKKVHLERVVPGVHAGAPSVALLRVTPKQAPDLIYADHLGDLSVTLPARE
ncbi:MAG: hypothetical protein ACRDJ5_04450 [Actinomycetota bacterium]